MKIKKILENFKQIENRITNEKTNNYFSKKKWSFRKKNLEQIRQKLILEIKSFYFRLKLCPRPFYDRKRDCRLNEIQFPC